MKQEIFKYESPIVEVVCVEVEKGFEGSGSLTPDAPGWIEGEEW